MHNELSNHYDRRLDATGLRCPLPIIQTKKELRELAFGGTLLIITTDPSFELDCQVFARQAGHKLLKSWQDGKNFYFVVQKLTK